MKSIIAILFGLTAIALVFFVSKPLWDDILTLRAESAVIADSLNRLHDVEALRDELLNKFNSIPKSDLERLEKLLPYKSDTEELLATYEELARARGMMLKSINFAAEASAQKLATATKDTSGAAVPPTLVNYTISITGSYEALRSMIDAMEKNLRLSDIGDLSFAASDNAVPTYTLKVRSYYQK